MIFSLLHYRLEVSQKMFGHHNRFADIGERWQWLWGGGGVWGVKMVTPMSSFLSRSQSFDKVDRTLAIDV